MRRLQMKKNKTSEETHARSGSVWKVLNQTGLKSKLPGPGGSADDKGSRGWSSGAPEQSRLKEGK